MNVTLAERKLAKTLASKRKLRKAYGVSVAREVDERLAVLKAAPSLAHVPATRPDRLHQLRGDRREQFAVDLGPQYRLVFEVDQEPIPRTADGGIDRNRVTAVVIVEVTDYH